MAIITSKELIHMLSLEKTQLTGQLIYQLGQLIIDGGELKLESGEISDAIILLKKMVALNFEAFMFQRTENNSKNASVVIMLLTHSLDKAGLKDTIKEICSNIIKMNRTEHLHLKEFMKFNLENDRKEKKTDVVIDVTEIKHDRATVAVVTNFPTDTKNNIDTPMVTDE